MDIDAGPLLGPSRTGGNVRRANITSGEQLVYSGTSCKLVPCCCWATMLG